MYPVGGEDLLIAYHTIEAVWDDRRPVPTLTRNGSCTSSNYKVWHVTINASLSLPLDSNKVSSTQSVTKITQLYIQDPGKKCSDQWSIPTDHVEYDSISRGDRVSSFQHALGKVGEATWFKNEDHAQTSCVEIEGDFENIFFNF